MRRTDRPTLLKLMLLYRAQRPTQQAVIRTDGVSDAREINAFKLSSKATGGEHRRHRSSPGAGQGGQTSFCGLKLPQAQNSFKAF